MATPLSNPSIVDFLNSEGKPSSFSARSKLAQQFGISNFSGTAAQNTKLLSILRAQTSTPEQTTPRQATPQEIGTSAPSNRKAPPRPPVSEDRPSGVATPTSSTPFIPAKTPAQLEAERKERERQFNINRYKEAARLKIQGGAGLPEIQTFRNSVPANIQQEVFPLLDTFIKAQEDPILNELFSDSAFSSEFDSWPPEFQQLFTKLLDSLDNARDAGNVVNPDIEITPEQADKFRRDAKIELDPFFQERLENFKQDFETSTQRLTEDFERGVRRAEEPFIQNLQAQAETEAQRGLTFGSERKRREQEAIQGQQRSIDDTGRNVERQFQDRGRQAERKIGSEAFADLDVPQVSQFNVNRGGFTPAGQSRRFIPQGKLLGEDVKNQEVALRARTKDLSRSFRTRRSINFSEL